MSQVQHIQERPATGGVVIQIPRHGAKAGENPGNLNAYQVQPPSSMKPRDAMLYPWGQESIPAERKEKK